MGPALVHAHLSDCGTGYCRRTMHEAQALSGHDTSLKGTGALFRCGPHLDLPGITRPVATLKALSDFRSLVEPARYP